MIELSSIESTTNTPSFETVQILLVEDNRTNQIVGQIMLKNLGCQVEIANDGQEAVDKTAVTAYDVVFMDIQMPIMNGYQATTAIRQREQQQNKSPATIIIAMTAHSLDKDKKRFLDTGMNDFIIKPFGREMLQEKLLRWV